MVFLGVIKDQQDVLIITGNIVILLILTLDIQDRKISIKDNRFGFFPAISGAWNVAEESIVKDNLKWVNMFKIRYSYGKTGNDNLGDTRFPYLYNLETLWERDNSGNVVSGNKPVGGYQFADFGYDRYYGGMRYTSVAFNQCVMGSSYKTRFRYRFFIF